MRANCYWFFLGNFTGLYQNHVLYVLLAGFLFVLVFNPEDGGSMVLGNVVEHPSDNMA
jgi:hypothetical protein